MREPSAEALTHRQSLYFQAPGQMQIRREAAPQPGQDQLLVETVVSAISAGTEMLFFRGQVPPGMSADATITGLDGAVRYPLKYGYACVGRVIGAGPEVADDWLGRLVFAFHPHESHFCAHPDQLLPVPDGITPEQAALLPNVETAVNLVMDGAPLVGERVAVIGQGIVGLLVTHLLARFPLDKLIAIDLLASRRQMAQPMGAKEVWGEDDEQPDLAADLIFELSGHPSGLNRAISLTGFGGRVVVGSWYGTKQARIDLGGHFHRNRIRLISSQVSTLAPALLGRWDKARRLEVAWSFLASIPDELLTALITHRFPLSQAQEAYNLLDQHPEQSLQILLQHENT